MHQDNNVDNFFGGFDNNNMLAYPIIQYVHVLLVNIAKSFCFDLYHLQRFLVSSYHDVVKERADRNLIFPALNASLIHCICPVLLM